MDIHNILRYADIACSLSFVLVFVCVAACGKECREVGGDHRWSQCVVWLDLLVGAWKINPLIVAVVVQSTFRQTTGAVLHDQ